MNSAVEKFIQAHEYFRALQLYLLQHAAPHERAHLNAELLSAYNEVEHQASIVAGVKFADGVQFAEG